MLRPDDVANLGDWLQQHRFAVSTNQLIAAARFLARAEPLPPVTALAPYLAPVFCSDEMQQRQFGDLYASWLLFRGFVKPDSRPKFANSSPASRRTQTWELWALLCAFATFALACALTWQYLVVYVDVAVLGDELPLARARVHRIGSDRDSYTDENGLARLAYRFWQLPIEIQATHPQFVEEDRFAVASGSLRSIDQHSLTLRLQSRPAQKAIDPTPRIAQRVALIPPPDNAQGGDEMQRSSVLHPLRLALLIGLVLAALGWWLLSAARRRGFLERLPRDDAAIERVLGTQAADTPLTMAGDLRHLARELRQWRLAPSTLLDVRRTLAATLRQGGRVQLVFGTRSEPEYVAIVERIGHGDHLARLADDLIAGLQARGVRIDRYQFESALDCCQHSPLNERTLYHGAQTLLQIFSRHPDSRLLIISDGTGLIDRYSGTPSRCVRALGNWSPAVVMTPVPHDQWGVREAALVEAGLVMLPIDGEGLRRLGRLYDQGAVQDDIRSAANGRMRPPYMRDVDLLLDRRPPLPDARRDLVDSLARDIGPEALAWAAGCAVYPELHWKITQALGDSLFRQQDAIGHSTGPIIDQRRYSRSIALLSRLPWFRHGYMPDWVRDALLSKLGKDAQVTIRRRLSAILESLSEKATGPIGAQLRFLAGGRHSFSSDVRAGLRAWRKRRRTPSVTEDGVFLRFMSGVPPRLTVKASQRLLSLLYKDGAPLAGPRFLSLSIVAALTLGLGSLAPPLAKEDVIVPGGLIQPVPTAIGMNGAGDLSVVGDQSGDLRIRFLPDARILRPRPTEESRHEPVRALLLQNQRFMAVQDSGTRALTIAIPTGSVTVSNPAGIGARRADSYGGAPTGESQLRSTGRRSTSRDDVTLCWAAIANTVLSIGSEFIRGLIEGGDPVKCATSANSSQLAVLTREGYLFVVPLRKEGAVPFRRLLTVPAGNAIQALAISDDGAKLAAIRLDHSVWLYNPGSRISRSLGNLDAVPPIAVSGDGSTLAFADKGRQVQILRLAIAQPSSLPIVSPVAGNASAAASDGRGLARAGPESQARPASSSVRPSVAPSVETRIASRPVTPDAPPGTSRLPVTKSDAEPATLGSGSVPSAPALSNQQPPPSRSTESEKVTFAADAFFDVGKSAIRPQDKAKLEDLVRKMPGIALETVIAVGHTDAAEGGSDAERQKLSVLRSEAVKSFLTSRGVEKNRVYTEGKGGKQPVADNRTIDGRAKNRRVEIEVVGTRSK